MGRIVVVDEWKITAPKTKDAATVLRKLRLTGSVLVVAGGQDELDVERSFANLPPVQTTIFGELPPTTCCGPTGWSSRTAPCRRRCRTSPAPTSSRRVTSSRPAGGRPRTSRRDGAPPTADAANETSGTGTDPRGDTTEEADVHA